MRGEGEGVIRRFKGTVSNTVDRACQVHYPLTQGKEKGKFLERFLKLFLILKMKSQNFIKRNFRNFYIKIKIKYFYLTRMVWSGVLVQEQMILYCIEKTQISNKGPGCLCTPASTYGARMNS